MGSAASLLAALALLLTTRLEAGQRGIRGGPDTLGSLCLEVVTFPQDLQAGFKDLTHQALLYHPFEKPDGKTPLMYAAMFDRVSALDALLARGAKVDARDGAGLSALDLARAMNARQAVARLEQALDNPAPK